jgi:hypothetical protein
MMIRRSFRRFAALAAVFAITLQALWPLLSHARPQDPSLQVPVCTIDGVTRYIEIKSGGTTPLDERSATHGEHCKLCLLGDGKAVLSATVGVVTAFRFPSHKVVGPQNSFQKKPPLLSAHPRAPPAVS